MSSDFRQQFGATVTGSAAAGGQSGFAASSAPVYRDAHETSLPLVVLGAVVAACSAIELAWSGGGLIFDWPMAAALAIAFTGLWLTFRRRAVSRGLSSPPGFGIAAIIGLAALVPPFVVILFYAGPFLSFGLGLAVAGVKLRNRVLTYWALAVGSIGVFEGFFGITNRLPAGIWAGWEHLAIYVVLGAATGVTGIVIMARERYRAS